MAEPFLAEIVMFGGNFAPRAWANCDGQLLAIAQNQALFSLLGTTYGGDGRTTFALPDMRGRVPIHPGTGPGLPPYRQGRGGGAQTATLTTANLPSHNHAPTLRCADDDAGKTDASGNVLANTAAGNEIYSTANADADMKTGANGGIVSNNVGNSQPFSITQSYCVVRFVICTSGIFPSRS